LNGKKDGLSADDGDLAIPFERMNCGRISTAVY
jgi:hypothetical protein